ncbi:uncharacterized protein LOC128388571 [Panonychus citri]|uniref:uncharacterized protein LOC128388571 n=1 Tax=Panonychus citri TaxID=50023 RepID=UPI0023075A90|nr:uncharacterized protein LOC128388571 [Panonychus citri]
MSPKLMYFNSFIFILVILIAFVACESPSDRPQKTNVKQSSCRYNKGPWSECANGQKTRTDTLRVPTSTPNCEPTRITTKKCKPACKYTKEEWSPCENGEKTRLLTRTEGDGPECERTKVIKKQCPKKGGPKPPKAKKPSTATYDKEA